jgi:general nucleoside transport system permease protein
MFDNKKLNIIVPITSVLLGLIAGGLIMIAFGYNPISGFIALWNGAFEDAYYTGETVRRMTPLLLSGLAVAFAFKTGLFNIGVEGQVIVGWLASVWVGITFDLPTIIHLPLAILAGALAGALWAFIPGILKAQFWINEVIVTIMLNYTALHLTNYIIRDVLTDGATKTENVAASASLKVEWLSNLTYYSSIHMGFIIALMAAIIMWFLVERTTLGYEMKAVGFNQHASKYAGVKVKRNIILSMIISGAFAGLAGVMEGLGTFQHMYVLNAFTNIGFDGIAVALLGGLNGFGIILAAALFGILKQGALNMPVEADVPTELVDIVIALIIFFVASSFAIKWLLTRFKKEGK